MCLPCVNEQVGKAQHIQFDPLRAHSVSIPAGGVCVVANSLVEASKVGVVGVDGGFVVHAYTWVLWRRFHILRALGSMGACACCL